MILMPLYLITALPALVRIDGVFHHQEEERESDAQQDLSVGTNDASSVDLIERPEHEENDQPQ
jgi:hypothetical protein